jgi:hypothetical protein
VLLQADVLKAASVNISLLRWLAAAAAEIFIKEGVFCYAYC